MRCCRPLWRIAIAAGCIAGIGIGHCAADERARDLTQSGRLPRSRVNATLLAEAERHIEQQEFRLGVELLQQILDADRVDFVTRDSRDVSTRSEAQRLIDGLPSAGWQVYKDQFDSAALAFRNSSQGQSWDQTLRQVVRRYRQTQAGLSALIELSAWEIDRGHFRSSIGCCHAILEHRLANRTQRVSAMVRLILSQLEGGESIEAQRTLDSYRDEMRTTNIPIQGNTVDVFGWLQGRIDSQLNLRDGTDGRIESDSPLDAPPNAAGRVTDDTVAGSITTRWQVNKKVPGEIQPFIDDALLELDQQGISDIPAPSPLVVGNVVVIRTTNEIGAYELGTGREFWRVPSRVLNDRPVENPKLLLNREFRRSMEDDIARQLNIDTVQGTLVSDGRSVFSIEQAGDAAFSTAGVPFRETDQRSHDVQASQVRSVLAARDVETGKLHWRFGPTDLPNGLENASDMEILGPPLVLDRSLLFLVQLTTEIRLISVGRRRGSYDWSVSLADADQSLDDQQSRRLYACPVFEQGGVILCHTSSGLLIAVDAITRTPMWAYRYGLHAADSVRDGRRRLPSDQADQWWKTWRRLELQTNGRLVIFVAPHSGFIHALEQRSGRRIWTYPVDEAHFIGPTSNGKLMVVGRFHVSAIDIETGTRLWHRDIGPTSGHGISTSTHYLHPFATGRMAAINLVNGEIEGVYEGTGSSFGNLAATDAGIISLRRERLSLLHVDFNGPRSSTVRGTTGDPTIDRLRGLDGLTINDRDLAMAAQSWKEIDDSEPNEIDYSGTGPRRIVAPHRAVRGELIDLTNRLSVEQQSRLHSLTETELQHLRSRQDRFGIRSFSDGFRELEVGRDLRIELATRADLSTGYMANQLALLQIASEQMGRPQSVDALKGLCRLAADHSYWDEAADAIRSIRNSTSDTVRVEDILADRSDAGRLQRELESGPTWPLDAAPKITSLRNSEPYREYFPIPIETKHGSLSPRVTVSIDARNSILRFQSNRVSDIWELKLPASTSPFRLAYRFHRGWELGQLLILRIGTELFGIAPLDERGEPDARLLWTTNTHSGLSWSDMETRFAPIGFEVDEELILDRYRRPIAQVGPVEPGRVCYRDKGMLTALDPLSGERLWQLRDLPFDCLVFGDGKHICLLQTHNATVTVLRGVDGKRVAGYQLADDELALLQTYGCRLLCDDPLRESCVLKLWDLAENRLVWRRAFSDGSVPFEIDNDKMGVLDTEGVLQIVDLQTGLTIAKSSIDLPRPLKRLHAIVDRSSVFIIAVGELTPNALQRRTQQFRTGYRNISVNGRVCCFDRSNWQMLWQRSFRDADLQLDQPKRLPLLFVVDYAGLTGGDNSKRSGSNLLILDKRSGRTLHQLGWDVNAGPVFAEGDFQRGRIDIQTASDAVRVEYSK